MSERDGQALEQQALDTTTDAGPEAAAVLEALLFVAAEPLAVQVLADVLDWNVASTRDQLDALESQLQHERRGLVLQRIGDRVQLVSAPRFGPLVAKLLTIERTIRISNAALETLAIIAYRQPVTRAEIESLRGVDSSGVLSTLIAREFIEVTGRRPTPGNPLEYATTQAFLQYFGIAALDELPDFDEGEGS